jgi:UDP-N-acetyl-D-galactosamine dehydrogenase
MGTGRDLDDIVIGVVGLGYVGLPLAAAFSEHFPVIGYDCNSDKVRLIGQGTDPTREVGNDRLKQVKAEWTSDPARLGAANFIAVCVPTPVDRSNNPDLAPVVSASETVGKHLAPGTIVVLESTVYPGVTEGAMGGILARESGLQRGTGFLLGYSPERINPGDRQHTLDKITKVVSGDDIDTIAAVYGKIAKDVYRAPSIRVAETAKVFENVQRDLNIAAVNELALICSKAGIDVYEVLKAAKTKWNFLDFKPGLVGGHCIGVDPYYLADLAQQHGHHAQAILAGRRVNDHMPHHVSNLVIRGLNELRLAPKAGTVGILGLTFKENINDCRNSKVKDIIDDLRSYGTNIVAHDPNLDPATVQKEFGIPYRTIGEMTGAVDAVLLAVSHDEYRKLTLDDLTSICTGVPCIIDIKALLDAEEARKNGVIYYRL